jgi:hypothetical protein
MDPASRRYISVMSRSAQMTRPSLKQHCDGHESVDGSGFTESVKLCAERDLSTLTRAHHYSALSCMIYIINTSCQVKLCRSAAVLRGIDEKFNQIDEYIVLSKAILFACSGKMREQVAMRETVMIALSPNHFSRLTPSDQYSTCRSHLCFSHM